MAALSSGQGMRMNSLPDFHITETPTLHFVATEDEQQLSQDLHARLEKSLQQAEEQPEVVAALEKNRAAEDRLRQLKKAESNLHRYAGEAGKELESAAEKTLGAIIASAAEGKPEFAKLSELAGIEARSRYAARALERLVEHLIPLAQVAQLRGESHELVTRARAMEKIAQERAERMLGQLRDAVSEEMVLPVDMSKGVAGALLTQAGELKKLALQQAENADRIEKSYAARVNKEIR
jgi:hypothetical protein